MRGKISRRALLTALSLHVVLTITLLALGDGWTSNETYALNGPPTPTFTPGPSPTPKPTDASGIFTGVYDLVADNGSPSVDLFHCISYLSHAADDTIQVKMQCYDNTGGLTSEAYAEPLSDAVGEGPSGDGFAVGPPPPPPFTVAAPAKGSGDWEVVSDTLTYEICLKAGKGWLGRFVGPYVFIRVTVDNAAAQASGTGKMSGSVKVWIRQKRANCVAKTPKGSPGLDVPLSMYPASDGGLCSGLGGDCLQSPFRSGPDADFDDDGCSDAAELNKLANNECGDDPWNPFDVNNADTDIEGDYSLLATVLEEDCAPEIAGDPLDCDSPDDHVPGFYYSCLATIEQSGKDVAAWATCYIDSPGLSVNPQRSPTCPAGCGDGSPGSPPPGVTIDTGGSFPTVAQRLFGDPATAADKQTKLTGTIDNTKNLLLLNGCFQDDDMQSPLGNVYVQAALDLHTMHGFVQIYSGQTVGNCVGATPTGAGGAAKLEAARQREGTFPMRDADSDGCGDRREMGSPGAIAGANLGNTKGGIRDPQNPYDYMNPTGDGLNRVDDIVATVNQYFDDDADATPGYPPFSVGYNQDTDRTSLTGANDWNLGPPNGLQRVDDIVAAVKSYFNDCNVNNFS